ncbi:MAG: VTT domain-containing protein [Gammaproteobacteria bacterium]|nr:VTT domain-containing protein [Gammaproteobacteria bacterium]MDH3858510.1 VTT domain-containing protein [Gammaproteobacteria bacterium]
MIKKHRSKLIIAALLITLGLAMEIAGLLDARQILTVAREYAQYWWLAVVLILAQALMFTFALAGSIFLWIAAPLYTPPMATFILAAGGALGGLGAYFFSNYLSQEWKEKVKDSRTYRTLQAQENFFTLFAMRVFPAFPHALVNYSAGILNARLSHFIAAAILGISIKSYIYARVIYSASNSASPGVLLDLTVIGPLVLLSVISAAGVFIKHRFLDK